MSVTFLHRHHHPIPAHTLAGRTNSARAADRDGQGMPTHAAPPRILLTVEQAAGYLRLAKHTLNKRRCTGDTPPNFELGRRVLYDQGDLDQWLEKQRRRSTSDRGVR